MEREFIYGLYSHIICGYMCFFKNLEDCINSMKLYNSNYTFNPTRNIMTNSVGKTVLAVHTIVLN